MGTFLATFLGVLSAYAVVGVAQYCIVRLRLRRMFKAFATLAEREKREEYPN